MQMCSIAEVSVNRFINLNSYNIFFIQYTVAKCYNSDFVKFRATLNFP